MMSYDKPQTLFRSKSVCTKPIHSAPVLRSRSPISVPTRKRASASMDNILVHLSRESLEEWLPVGARLHRTEEIQCLILPNSDVIQQLVQQAVNGCSQPTDVSTNGRKQNKKAIAPRKLEFLTSKSTKANSNGVALQKSKTMDSFAQARQLQSPSSPEIKDGVQLRRCLSLYERQRTPHSCYHKDHAHECEARSPRASNSPRPSSAMSGRPTSSRGRLKSTDSSSSQPSTPVSNGNGIHMHKPTESKSLNKANTHGMQNNSKFRGSLIPRLIQRSPTFRRRANTVNGPVQAPLANGSDKTSSRSSLHALSVPTTPINGSLPNCSLLNVSEYASSQSSLVSVNCQNHSVCSFW